MHIRLQPSNAAQEKKLIVIADEEFLQYRGVEGIECNISRHAATLGREDPLFSLKAPKNVGVLRLIDAKTLGEVEFAVFIRLNGEYGGGKSPYEIAVEGGFKGTVDEWQPLIDDDKTQEQLAEIKKELLTKRPPVATEVFFGKLLHDVAKNCSLIVGSEEKRHPIQQARHSQRCLLGVNHLLTPSEYLRI